MILSLSEQYVQFLIDLADFGCRISNTQIKECTRGIIDLLPIAKHTGERIKQLCKDSAQKQQQQASSSNSNEESGEAKLEKFYTNCTQTQCWYNLKVTHALLLPAIYQFNPDETKQFQVSCLKRFNSDIPYTITFSGIRLNSRMCSWIYALSIGFKSYKKNMFACP